MRTILLITALILLIATEILRVYFIMPFPGSQRSNTIDIAYWLDRNMIWIRLVLLAIIIYPCYYTLLHSRIWRKILLSFFLVLYGLIFSFFNFRFLAEKMFYQPNHIQFASGTENKISGNKLILGVEINGEAKAYPIQLIGYHHQVRDSIGGTAVMVTYCTVCRTGRVFSPFVNGKYEKFRLVGMDHFNAMFEDASTKSWWRQVSGEAIAGPLKGTVLKEIPSQQMSLDSWLQLHPNSSVLQADPDFKKQYDDLSGYDEGTIASSLEKRDSLPWKAKSWIIGITHEVYSKAWDWNELFNKKYIQDSLPGLPLLISLENDGKSFHAWNRMVDGNSLQFTKSPEAFLKDLNTGSYWNQHGVCKDGPLKGSQLQNIQASQEFWHSWLTFHPDTKK